jgi:hypothetical protein
MVREADQSSRPELPCPYTLAPRFDVRPIEHLSINTLFVQKSSGERKKLGNIYGALPRPQGIHRTLELNCGKISDIGFCPESAFQPRAYHANSIQ